MIFNFNASEVFDIAIKIEENGKMFYDHAKEMVDDLEVKRLFEELGRQEIDHKARFEAMKAQLPPEASKGAVFDPNNELQLYIKMMADQHVFISSDNMESRLKQIKDSKDALRLAIEFEKDSVIFFLSMQDATEGKKGQELIGALVREEQEHLRRLSLELKRIAPK